jgi:WD40 repeat protein
MPRPRHPSRIETITFPVFGISWFGNPGDGTSYTAYCGGGGSAKTGVFNSCIVQTPESQNGNEDALKISTGDKVGVAIHIFQNPVTGKIWLVIGMDKEIQRFSLPSGELDGVIDVGEGVNAVGVNAMADRLAVGCDSGLTKVYSMADDAFDSPEPVYTCEGHTKTVCACAFSPREGRLLTSAKDGTACVWKDGTLLSTLTCSVEDPKAPKAPKPKRPPQVLVRGCAWADLEGKVALTIASGRRGRAFLSQWVEGEKGKEFECAKRTGCSPCPISAMSLSDDAGLMALGSVDGSIILWDVEKWKVIKTFKEVHDLPVTGIAARPYPVPLQGEENGVQIHARSASADSQLACLTLQRRGPPAEKKQGRGSIRSGPSVATIMNRLIAVVVVLWALYPILQDMQEKCAVPWQKRNLGALRQCVVEDVLLAPSWRAGVSSPPY